MIVGYRCIAPTLCETPTTNEHQESDPAEGEQQYANSPQGQDLAGIAEGRYGETRCESCCGRGRDQEGSTSCAEEGESESRRQGDEGWTCEEIATR